MRKFNDLIKSCPEVFLPKGASLAKSGIMTFASSKGFQSTSMFVAEKFMDLIIDTGVVSPVGS